MPTGKFVFWSSPFLSARGDFFFLFFCTIFSLVKNANHPLWFQREIKPKSLHFEHVQASSFDTFRHGLLVVLTKVQCGVAYSFI